MAFLWIGSHLTSRSQAVSNHQLFRHCILYSPLSCGVSQSSILGPLLFILFSKKAWRHLSSNTDVLGLGLPSDNNFQPIASFVSLEMLGNEIVVGVTLLGYDGETRDLLSLRIVVQLLCTTQVYFCVQLLCTTQVYNSWFSYHKESPQI